MNINQTINLKYTYYITINLIYITLKYKYNININLNINLNYISKAACDSCSPSNDATGVIKTPA